MVESDADWKNQPQNLLDWLLVVISLVLLTLYLSLWVTDSGSQYVGFGLFFVAWLGVFFSDYWQPILYLFGVLAVAFITWPLFSGGVWEQLIGQVAIFFNIVFLLTSIYLFSHEER